MKPKLSRMTVVLNAHSYIFSAGHRLEVGWAARGGAGVGAAVFVGCMVCVGNVVLPVGGELGDGLREGARIIGG